MTSVNTWIQISRKVCLPKYRPYFDNNDRTLVLWGGRDSGKSYFSAQKIIKDCLALPYFRCILVKKTYESIKDSQYQTIKDVVNDMGLSDYFTFKVNPLEVYCVNGNKIIARGCDKPEKLKSIKDPSHAWYEEANHLSYDDYATITSTLRSKGQVQEIFSFNPEHDQKTPDEFWIYRLWFAGNNDRTFSGQRMISIGDIEIPITYTCVHSTYEDNAYCPDERKAILEGYRYTSEYHYQVFCRGNWAVRQADNPYFTAFDEEKHVSEKAVFQETREIRLGFDFNVDNTACTLSQASHNYAHWFDEIGAANLPELCQKIKEKYGNYRALFKVTGDYSGTSRHHMQTDDLNSYRMIKNKLGLKGSQFKVYRNPKHRDNRFTCNTFLQFFPNVIIHPRCKNLIFDLKYAECDDQENLIKKDRSIASQKVDFGDSFRYTINAFHYNFVKKYLK